MTVYAYYREGSAPLTIFNNYPLLAALFAFIFTQVIKVPTAKLMGRDAPSHLIISTGGMPSSHTAGVCSLFTALVIEYSIESPIVAVSGIYASLVINDAVKVRRQSGEQTILLRRLITEVQKAATAHDFKNKDQIMALSHHLRPISLGHKPSEVLVGGIVGVLISLIFKTLFYS